MQAFMVNRLEVSLRLAWLNCNNGKKRGVKLKEKVNAAGMAANVYWRKKGSVDWWGNLDDAMRRKVLTVTLGKAAKSLTREVLMEASKATEDGMWFFNAGMKQSSLFYHTKSLERTISTLSADVECGIAISPASLSGIPTFLANVYNGLFVLQDITTMVLSSQHNEYDIEKIFFSSLSFINTITDCILRKLRGFLMVVLLDCTKLELFGEGNFKSSPNISKDKASPSGCRRKGRARSMKKQYTLPKLALDELSLDKPPKVLEGASTDAEKVDWMGSDKLPSIPNWKDIPKETSTSEMEMVVCHQKHAQALVAGNGRTNARKTKREENKNKNCTYSNAVPVKYSKISVSKTSSIIMQDEMAMKALLLKVLRKTTWLIL